MAQIKTEGSEKEVIIKKGCSLTLLIYLFIEYVFITWKNAEQELKLMVKRYRC